MTAAMRASVLVGLVATAGAAVAAGQDTQKGPRPSQHGTVSQRVNETTITIEYDRPVARGRELFGKLVPYGRIWNPGANDATTVEVSTPVKVNGQDLPEGRYSLWAIPRDDEWTVIFNRQHAVWHTKYPEGQDALRLQIKPETGSHMETMAFYFPVVEGRTARLVLHWGSVVVPMDVEVP